MYPNGYLTPVIVLNGSERLISNSSTSPARVKVECFLLRILTPHPTLPRPGAGWIENKLDCDGQISEYADFTAELLWGEKSRDGELQGRGWVFMTPKPWSGTKEQSVPVTFSDLIT